MPKAAAAAEVEVVQAEVGLEVQVAGVLELAPERVARVLALVGPARAAARREQAPLAAVLLGQAAVQAARAPALVQERPAREAAVR